MILYLKEEEKLIRIFESQIVYFKLKNENALNLKKSNEDDDEEINQVIKKKWFFF
jgi:hypothetical protein